MKLALGLFALTVGQFVFAVQPPDIGHFKGLAFSSSTVRQPLEIIGGQLVQCKAKPDTSDFTTCEVENGSIVVLGTEGNGLNVKITRGTVLYSPGKNPTRHYYLRGTSDLTIGEKAVAVEVKVVLNFEDASPNLVRGLIELPDQYAKTSLEAYRLP